MKPDQVIDLTGARQQVLGQIRVESEEAGLLLGKFVPGSQFASVERLFRDFEEAADRQALHQVEKLDGAVAALGIRLVCRGSPQPIEVRDVQIWSDGGFSCRLVGQMTLPTNGGVPKKEAVHS